jgi:hypothetical protein
MQISIINHTGGMISDEEIHRVIRAINRQITEDFAPYWGMSATLRLEGRSTESPDTMQIPDLRGDAVIYLWNDSDIDDALGYHFQNARGIPFGFVFTEIAQRIGEPWTVTLSHEVLELIGDPETNLLVMGPHPSEDRDVFHWFEMCDAVQNEYYLIDGVEVSNFLLPLYFTGTRDTDEIGARNDFLGRNYGGQTLKSFGINPGGYIGFFDPELSDHDTFTIRGDAVALMRMEQKSKAKETRRSVRYRSFKERDKMRLEAPDGEIAKKYPKIRTAAAAATSPAFTASGERIYASTRKAAAVAGTAVRAVGGRLARASADGAPARPAKTRRRQKAK